MQDQVRAEPWPSWAKVLVALMALLIAATLLPALVMWSMCASMSGSTDMQHMFEMMRGAR